MAWFGKAKRLTGRPATVVISFAVDEQNIGDKADYVFRWAFPLGYASITGMIALIYMSIDQLL